MRFYEIMKPRTAIKPKRQEDPQIVADRQARARDTIEKARLRTARAAQAYDDQRQAGDEAEEKARRSLMCK